MKASLLVLPAALAVLGLASPAHAATISSTFDTDADGWVIGDMNSAGAPGGSTTPATYNATGGNPGGYISTTDTYAEVAFFAPSKFLGDLSASYGGSLSFDLTDNQNDNRVYASVVLYSNGQSVAIASAPPSTTGFTHYSFALNESSFVNYLGGGLVGTTPVSKAQLQYILSDVTGFAIHADWHTGDDLSALDNVVLSTSAVPELSTWAMLLTGFAGLGFTSWRARKPARA